MLVSIWGPDIGTRHLLRGPETIVGNDPSNHVFLDDLTVCRRHARILRGDHQHRVADLGSLTGTYVNGARIEETVIAHGDELRVGLFRMMFLRSWR